MHVGSVRFDRARNQLINEPDDRGFAGQILEPLRVLLGRLGSAANIVEQDPAGVALLGFGVEAIERGFQLDRHRDHHDHRPAQCRRNRIPREGIERVRHRNDGGLVVLRDRQGVRLAQKLWLQPVAVKRFLGIILEAGDRRLDELGQRAGEAALADHAELRQDPVEAAAGFRGDMAGPLQRAVIDQPLRDKDGAEPRQLVGSLGRGWLACQRGKCFYCHSRDNSLWAG